jgi:hypothetical protein
MINSSYYEEYGELSQYSVWLQTGRLGDRGSIPGRGKGFFLQYRIQTSSDAYPASYPMGIGGPFPGVKRGRGKTLTTSV